MKNEPEEYKGCIYVYPTDILEIKKVSTIQNNHPTNEIHNYLREGENPMGTHNHILICSDNMNRLSKIYIDLKKAGLKNKPQFKKPESESK